MVNGNLGLIYYSLMSTLISTLAAWMPDLQANIKTEHENVQNVPIFFGNNSAYFKILDQDENSLLIGARNAVYNLSLNGLRENYNQRIQWSSSDADRELCALKGKQEQDCQNYIRVFARTNENQIMFCGTNSYKPRCRYYNIYNSGNGSGTSSSSSSSSSSGDGGGGGGSSTSSNSSNEDNKSFEVLNEIEAQGRCPYNPTHNSTYIYTDGQLYSATVADFSGADSLIYREPQRTEQYDLKQLNQPAFVSALERNGYVFFFFREIAMEYMNCGKAIYSRVGRVCKNDKGGPLKSYDRWTSFLKTRLNCSVPGEYPFYFDEIQATSKIIDGLYRGGNKSSVIYAVFTTSINAIPGSAVCAFTINDILRAFEGRFKYQRDSNSNWLAFPAENVPEPRPGKCVDDSRTLSSTSVNFVKTHTLMEISVPPLYGRPLLTRVSLHHRLTAITVDPQILAMDGNTYDVIFVGTDDGKVLKFINTISPDSNEIKTIIITEMQVLPKGMPVRELTVAHKTERLIVIADGRIASAPLYHCSDALHCQSCIQLQDPYCIWDISNHECRAITTTKTLTSMENFIQNLNSTKIAMNLCKQFSDVGNRIDQAQNSISSQSTRATLSSIGKMPQNGDFEGRITVTSVDPAGLTNMINDPFSTNDLGIEGEKLHMASNNFYWGFAGIILILVFGIGILVGLYSSKRLCKSSPFNTEHRNQLSSKNRPFQHRSSGKDVNLLMNTNPFSQVPCNNKKDNLEHEFVGDKDRSHECKNSTENLEKEVHCKTEDVGEKSNQSAQVVN